MKVTVKDTAGNPMPGMPFTLKRGDGYTRNNERHVAGSDNIVSPVVVDAGMSDEASLNDSATAYAALTDADGSKILTITRPETHGTKTAITAALYSDPTINASIDTIFTVPTSPDTDKAKMWGHMPETLTAGGLTFKRPLLFAELAVTKKRKSRDEENETWRCLPWRRLQMPVIMAVVRNTSLLRMRWSPFPAVGRAMPLTAGQCKNIRLQHPG